LDSGYQVRRRATSSYVTESLGMKLSADVYRTTGTC